MNIGMISATMDASHIGRREFSDCVWYRTDRKGQPGEVTLYVLDKDDFTPCVLVAKPDSACWLCRTEEPHTTTLHDKLRFMDNGEQQKLYGEI